MRASVRDPGTRPCQRIAVEPAGSRQRSANGRPRIARARALTLAPRILYSADSAALLPDAVADDHAVQIVQAPAVAPQVTIATQPTNQSGESVSADTAAGALYVIDAGIDDGQSLADQLRERLGNSPDAHVLVVDTATDGPRAITDALSGIATPVSAVHIFSHGNASGFQLGNLFVDSQSLRANADTFAAWNEALAPGADLLLYGCELAADAGGQQLIADLAALTGADVAASDDLTGAAAAGADWRLEHHQGAIETATLSLTGLKGTLNLAPTSGETRVNDSGGGDHTPEFQSSGQVATNGASTVVVWENGDDIRFRIYGANDSGGQQLVDRSGVSAKRDQPAVAMNAAGDFVIVWTSDNGNGGTDIYAQLFAADGTPIASPAQPGGENWANGFEFRVNQRQAGDKWDPAVEIRDDGSFIVSWTTNDTVAGNHDQIAFRQFGASGAAVLGSDTLLDDDGTSNPQSHSRVSWDSVNDRFAVSYLQNQSGRLHVSIREVLGDGSLGILQTIVNPPGTGEVIEADVAMRSDGHVAVAIIYEESGIRYVNGGSADVFGGATAITFVQANGTASPSESNVSIAIGDNDAAVIVWDDNDTDGGGQTSFGRHFDAAWNPSSANSTRLPQTTGGGGDQLSPHLAISGTDVSIVWSGTGTQPGEDDGNGIFIRSYSIAVPDLIIDTSSGTGTTEDGAGNTLTISVSLARAPSAGVTVNVSSDDTTEGTVSPAALTFSTANWDTPQTITVTGVRDFVQDGDVVYNIDFAATSGDAGYDGMTRSTALTSIDTDQPVGPISDTDGAANTVGELAAPGTAVGITANATDANAGDSVQYFIDDGASPFTVGLNDGIIRVAVSSGLDHETAPSVDVTVRARSSDGSESTRTFTVTVTDQNDPPVGGDFALDVQAGETIPITMADIVYSDQDGPAQPTSVIVSSTPTQGTVLRDGTPVTAGTTVSAADIIAGNLAYETPTAASGASYDSFTIRFVDDGGAQSTAVSTVTINANAAPVITSNGGGNNGWANVDENTTAVTTVTSTDADGPGATYSIVGGEDAAFFTIDPVSGALAFASAPDYENPLDNIGADNTYGVIVRIEDGAGGADEQLVLVAVRNVDEAPTGGDVTRAMTAGQDITIQAADITFNDPEGEAAAASIRISVPPANGSLTLAGAPVTPGTTVTAAQISAGELIYSAPINGSGVGYDNITFHVRDSAGNEAVVASTISIDVNGLPVITSDGGGDMATIGVNENTTAVRTVTATDPDGPTRVWSIVNGADQAHFTIDSATGDLSFVSAPDFESATDANGDNAYEVTVMVSDGAGGEDKQAITVQVLDANEAPTGADNRVSPTATVSLTLAVTDFPYADADGALLPESLRFDTVPANGGLLFDGAAVAPGTTIQSAAIDAGRLTYLAPDGATGVGYDSLDFTVFDVGGLFASTPSTLFFDVNGRPTIQSDGGGTSASLTVDENQTAVTTVSATDPDSAALSYSLAGGADLAAFTIDPGTGVLSFALAPDAETPGDANGDGVYEVVVRADDAAQGIDDQALFVTVTNVNEAPASADFTVAATATVPRTLALGDFPFSDPEDVSVTAIRFDAVPLNGNLLLDLTPLSNGDVVTAAQLSAGRVTYVAPEGATGTPYDTASFSVIDSGTLAASPPSTMSIQVNARPLIESDGGGPIATINVTEGQTAVTTVVANDPDGPATTYSFVADALLSPDSASFTIDPGTGVVTFNSAPDFEAPADANGDGIYRITVRSDDGVGGTDQQTLRVVIANTPEPFGLSAPAVANAIEDTPSLLSDAGPISFNDPDLAPDVTIRLSVDEGSLSLPASGGWTFVEGDGADDPALAISGSPLALLPALDAVRYMPAADDNGLASLRVQISDTANPARRTTVDVQIQIAAVNDAPVVGGSLSATTTSGGSTPIVGQMLSATDVDDLADQITFTVVVEPSSGELMLAGVRLASGETFTQADIDAGLVAYRSTGADTETDEIELSIADSLGAGNLSVKFLVDVAGLSAPSATSSGLPTSGSSGGDTPSESAGDDGGSDDNGDSAEDSATTTGWIASNAGSSGAAGADAGAASGEASGPTNAPQPVANQPVATGRTTEGGRGVINAFQAQTAHQFGYEGYRLTDLDAFESLGNDRIDNLAQSDRVWLNAPIENLLARTFAENRQVLDSQLTFETQVVASTAAVSTGVSIGYVLWLLRGGALLSSIIASMPAWRSIDPLPVLSSLNNANSEGTDSESLESMLDQANNQEADAGSAEAGHEPMAQGVNSP